jgi:DNA-binding transcriptional ArsR family regulator
MVNDVFGALAHPLRCRIVERLAAGPTTVGRATAGFAVSKPAISRHVRVLEDAGVVVRTIAGRTHRLHLNMAALDETAAWIDRRRVAWERVFDAVEEQLAAGGALGDRGVGR